VGLRLRRAEFQRDHLLGATPRNDDLASSDPDDRPAVDRIASMQHPRIAAARTLNQCDRFPTAEHDTI
jgi:hypothetical protein